MHMAGGPAWLQYGTLGESMGEGRGREGGAGVGWGGEERAQAL